MLRRLIISAPLTVLLAIVPSFASKAPKHIGPPIGSNDIVEVIATPVIDQNEVVKLLGADPGFPLIVLQVKVNPKGDNKIRLNRDDFTLISGRDGQRSEPMEPGQIAGKGSIRVNTQKVAGSSGGISSPVPVWGGGTPTGGPVYGGPPMGGGVMGSNTADVTEAKATVNNNDGTADSPLLKALKGKILPETDSNDPTTGLLYFMFDGKLPKQKDLSLIYKTPQGRVIIDFK